MYFTKSEPYKVTFRFCVEYLIKKLNLAFSQFEPKSREAGIEMKIFGQGLEKQKSGKLLCLEKR